MEEVDWQETIKRKHGETIKAIELAKNAEDQHENNVALINFKLAIKLIDEAMATPVELPEDPDEIDESWYSTLRTVQTLKRMRGEVMHRIAQLSPSTSDSNTDNNLPQENGNRPRTFSELAEALQNIEITDKENLPNVLELLFLCEGVKLYHINVNGEVTTEDESSTLRIIRLDQDIKQNLDATYFMQIIRSSVAQDIQQNDDVEGDDYIEEDIENDIGAEADFLAAHQQPAKKIRSNTPPKQVDSSLVYPLVPGVSPCFRTEFGAFIFPDIQSDVDGTAFGVVIPKTVDEIVLEILESILHGVVRQTQATEDGAEETEDLVERLEQDDDFVRRDRRYASDRISENIVHGACILSNGLVKGTEHVGKLISYTTPYIISKLNRAPANPNPLSNKVVTGVEIARTATGVVNIFVFRRKIDVLFKRTTKNSYMLRVVLRTLICH